MHVTIVTLSWHERNFVVIDRAHFKPEHCKFWSSFEFDRNIVSGPGIRSPRRAGCGCSPVVPALELSCHWCFPKWDIQKEIGHGWMVSHLIVLPQKEIMLNLCQRFIYQQAFLQERVSSESWFDKPRLTKALNVSIKPTNELPYEYVLHSDSFNKKYMLFTKPFS